MTRAELRERGYDTASYNRGWTTALHTEGGALDRADVAFPPTPDAWYDGYYDAAAGREKWHIPNCPAHHNNEGGCGKA